MSWFESVSPKAPHPDLPKPLFDSAAMTQIGALSPLWMLFLSASTAGMAYWGMTYWMRLATPEKLAENVVKLRLVKSEPAPAVMQVAAPAALAPEPAMVEPVVAEVASVSIVAPEPAAAAAPEVVKIAPKPKAPKAIKAKPLTTETSQIVAPEPVVTAKVPARRGRPPKVAATPVAPEPAKAAVQAEPEAVAPIKAAGAKRGPKPKIKA